METTKLNTNQLNFAGFWIRLFALAIDYLILVPIIIFKIYNLYKIKSLTLQIILILMIILYKPLLEFFAKATIGKMIFKLKVLGNNFKEITIGRAITRSIPWMIGQIISIYITLIVFSTEDFATTNNWTDSGIINLLGFDFLSLTIMLISFIFIGFNNEKRGIYDYIAKTYCVRK